jgi:succinate-semialdehyde dehydrogenase/glutarate-semialdehyde dehydrogenase
VDASQELLRTVPSRLFIGGEWRDAELGGTFDVHDPGTGATIAVVADAGIRDAAAAIEAAVQATNSWETTPPRARANILRDAFDLLQSRQEQFALLITLEMGKPISESRAEVEYGGNFLRWFSEEAVRVSGRYGLNPEANGVMTITRRPVGPTLLVTPWNFPLAMATRKIAPALAAGCTVIVKPSELTPLTTLYLTATLEEAGLPPGVLNVLTTTDSPALVSDSLSDPRIRKLSFTGSTRVGKKLIEQSARNALRVSMELGGNAPFVVFEDADLDRAVDGAMAAKFRNGGQACTAANRFLVHRNLAEAFSQRIVERVSGLVTGHGTHPSVTLGPLINSAAAAKVDELVRDSLERGAVLRAGGRPLPGAGSFYEATVLTSVPHDSRILREEIFGPVLAIVEFDDEDEAVRLAADTEYGLAAYVYTEDIGRGNRMIDRLDVGMMGLNIGSISNAAAPFGGVRLSGYGREGGPEGINEYLSTKYTLTAVS